MTPNGNRDIQKEMNHTRKNKNIKKKNFWFKIYVVKT